MTFVPVLGTQARVWWHTSDLTDYLNSLDLPSELPANDVTTFGHTIVVETPGLGGTHVGFSGFGSYGAGEIDALLNAALVAQTVAPFTVSLGGNVVGALALFCKGTHGAYNTSVAVGDAVSLDGELWSRVGLKRGKLLKALAAVSGAGTTFTTAVDYLTQTTGGYDAALHVTAGAGTGGPSLTVTVQSCPTQAGVYVDAFSFTVLSGVTPTSEYKSASGVTLDRWRRCKIVLAGTGPAYTFGVALAGRA